MIIDIITISRNNSWSHLSAAPQQQTIPEDWAGSPDGPSFRRVPAL